MTNASLLSLLAIRIDGQTPARGLVESIEQIQVETSLHLPSVATIVIHDPTLEWLDSAGLEPGKSLEIFPDSSKLLFDGEIVEVEAELGVEGQRVIVRAFDRLHRLARGVHARAFKQVSDGEIVRTCASDAGLTASYDPTPGQHAYFIQANESNLAMLQRRAAACGFLLYADGKRLCFKAPAAGATVTLELSQNLISFRPRVSAAGYLEQTSVRGWNPAQKQAVLGESRPSAILPKVGLSFKDYLALRPAERSANLTIQSQDVARHVAQALTDAYVSRFIEAEGVSLGNPALKAGVSLEVKNVGRRFSGSYFVTSATHRLLPGDSYQTEFSVSGLNPASLLGMLAPPEPLGQPLGSLTVGIVSDNNDPDGMGRVRLKLPLLFDEKTSTELVTDWVRIAAPGAGSARGMFFLPEVNDEVLVAFGQGEINLPFVLGLLWNGQDKPPGDTSKVVASGKVNQRTIYSRSGHYIMFDDSDAEGGISIIDKNNNKIVLKAKDNTLSIETGGDIRVTTKGKLSLDVTGDASLKAQGNLTLEASGNLTLKANGKADLNGTAGVNIQGAMINLN